jgi:hypothetical protein
MQKLADMMPELEGIKKELSQLYEAAESERQAQQQRMLEEEQRRRDEIEAQMRQKEQEEALKSQQFNSIQESLQQQQEQEQKYFSSFGKTGNIVLSNFFVTVNVDPEFQPYSMLPSPSAPTVDIKLEQKSNQFQSDPSPPLYSPYPVLYTN